MNLSLTGSQISAAKKTSGNSARSNCSSTVSSATNTNSIKNGYRSNSHQNLNDKTKTETFQKTQIKQSHGNSSKAVKSSSSKDLSVNATPLTSARTGTQVTKHSVFTRIDSARSTSTGGGTTDRSHSAIGRGSTNKRGSSVSRGNASNTEKRRGATLDMFLDLKQLDQDTEKLTKWFNSQDKDWDDIAVLSDKGSPRQSTEPELKLQLNNSHASNAFGDNSCLIIDDNFTGASYDPDSSRTLTPPLPDNENKPVSVTNYNSGILLQSSAANFISPARRNSAAVTIQRWYRRHVRRQRANQAALRRIMEEKKRNFDENREKNVLSIQSFTTKKTKSVDEKRQQERQDAIKELHRKREEKRQTDQKTAEEEVKRLKEIGSIKTVNKKPRRNNLNQEKEVIMDNQTSKSIKDTNNTLYSDNTEMTNHQSAIAASWNTDELNQESDSSPAREVIPDQLESDRDAQSATTHKTTVDDILSTLRELEGNPPLNETHNSGNNAAESRNAWGQIVNDIDKLLNDNSCFESALPKRQHERKHSSNPPLSSGSHSSLTSDNVRQHQLRLSSVDQQSRTKSSKVRRSAAPAVATGIDENKLNSILNFLDTADEAERVSQLDSGRDKDPYQEQYFNKETEVNSQMAVNEIKSHVMSQRLELEERTKTVAKLQKALQQQRELTVRQVRETQKDMERQMALQRKELDNTIERNYTLIDQLIEEKKVLQEKCDTMLKELKTVKQKAEERVKAVEEKSVVELKKVEAKHAAAEKLRREKWEADKTKIIKEMTVKGMEHEIAQLIAGHKAEIRRLKAQHETDLMQADEKAYQNYGKHVEELRAQLTREKDEACQKEREMAKQRYESQLESETQALEAQRKRLYNEVQDERERLAAQAAKQKAELDRMKDQLDDQASKSSQVLKKEYEQARAAQEERHKAELRELRDRLEAEKQTWEETYLKKQEGWLLAKEREMKEQVKRDRDREIELVIERLEEDNTSSREQLERASETKLKRMREKYEAEMAELERSERQAMDKYNQFKAKILEVEGDNERLKVLLKQKEKETEDIRQLYEKLNRERDHASDIIRQEFADRLVATDEENRRLKSDISELKARLSQEQQKFSEHSKKLQNEKEVELQEVHNKVKEAIKRKDEHMLELRNQYQREIDDWSKKYSTAVQRSEHLEGLLEQQRKQLLQLKK